MSKSLLLLIQIDLLNLCADKYPRQLSGGQQHASRSCVGEIEAIARLNQRRRVASPDTSPHAGRR